MQRRRRGLAGEVQASSDVPSTLPTTTPDAREQEIYTRFPNLFSTAKEFNVPIYPMWGDVGVPEPLHNPDIPGRRSYATGAGFSARVIRHQMVKGVGNAKAGQLVALKNFRINSNDNSTLPTVYEAVIREIKALKHPLLNDHENICDLFCIAWIPGEFPINLILELGSYGTLEDVLGGLTMGPSWLQKMNMTIDISLGLRAIHDAGIIHGDIKPANIIIQKHENRQIVAKFIDFGGAASSDTSRPGMRTEIWSAPEVIMGGRNIDWKSADVYSYGLVIASIWARRLLHQTVGSQTSCFLERYLPPALSESQRSQRMLIMKTDPDPEASGAGDSIGMGVLSQSLIKDEHFINDLLCMTLLVIPDKRKSMSIITSTHMPKLCKKIGRDTNLGSPPKESVTTVLTPTAKGEPEYLPEFVFESLEEIQLGTTDPPWYRESGRDHPLIKLLVCICAPRAEPAKNAMAKNMHLFTDWKSDVTNQPSKLLEITLSTLAELGQGPDLGDSHKSAYTLAELEVNSDSFMSEHDRLNYIYASVLGGSTNSLVMAPLLGDSYDAHLPEDSIKLFCLVIGTLFKHQQSATLLRESRPDLHESTRRILQAHIPLSLKVDRESVSLYLKEIQTAPLLDKHEADLLTLIASQNIEEVKQFLERQDCDATITDMYGVGALYYLSYLSDEEATSLAKACHDKGASLTQETTKFPYYFKIDPDEELESTPLRIAIRKRMPRYSVRLLELHIETSTPVPNDGLILLESVMYDSHNILQVMLERLSNNPHIFPQISKMGSLSHFALKFTRELRLDLDTPISGEYLDMRINNGRNFQYNRRSVLRLMLDLSKELPEWPDHISQLVMASVVRRDHIALQAILECYKDSEPAPSYEELSTRLLHHFLASISLSQHRCFDQFLKVFPELAKLKTTEGRSMLFHTIKNDDPYFTKEILQLGACYNNHGPLSLDSYFTKGDEGAEYCPPLDAEQFRSWSSGLDCPLFFALLLGRIGSATLIYDSLTDCQQQLVLPELASGNIVGAWVDRHNLGILNSIDWMIERGKLSFLGFYGAPTWMPLIARSQSGVPEHVDLDVQMARKLFEAFPDRLSYVDYSGKMAIHWVARHGHVGMLELLLAMGVGINTEARDDNRTGLTALDLAKSALSDGPDIEIKTAGKAVISRWRRRLQETISLLESHGAELGRFSTDVDLEDSNSTTSHDGVDQFDMDEYDLQDLNGGYPLRLGLGHASPTIEEQEKAKNWMKVKSIDGQVKKLSRRLVNAWLKDNLNQPESGLFEKPPEQYSDFLERAVASRKKEWAINCQDLLPPDLGLDPRVREWHEYGAMITKAINDSVELIPRFHRLIVEMESPSTISDPNIWDLLGHLNETRRVWNPEPQSSQVLTKRIDIVSKIPRKLATEYAFQEAEKQLSDLQVPKDPGDGFVLVVWRILDYRTDLTPKEVGIIQKHIGSCLVFTISRTMVGQRPVVAKRFIPFT
ncbi:hypothetical protein F5Y00DRAFT_267978 [Daldinia vernicosa]|uniref:uncharacterized protein n=1 Tax=Daldinia vernicosa TaxID=114800 RepID=UPI0020076C0C|nr:uncharacterized protein F5Y00DRAFT_267978 [Daldinia vernicosa]KAI0843798.1 hypothetical protein F5Y00DRAFT_267978 [Daldinia vernicosa]